MPVVNTLHPEKSDLFELLSNKLKTHYIKVYEVEGSSGLKNFKLENIKPLLKYVADGIDVLLAKGKDLYVFKKNCYIVYDDQNLGINISNYIIDSHKYGSSSLSCRTKDIYLLEKMVVDGSPDFSKSPEKWIRTNPFFKKLRPKPFYDRLLAFNLDKRGIFLKVWTYRAQRNYFHPSVNSELPLIKKDDPVHEGTFMMHDMFHYIFRDPIITGHETDEERVVYITCRMISEACTLVLADMIAVAHSGIEDLGYDITQRKIYPLFKFLKLNPYDIETIRKVLYANCVYVMFGDTSVYKKLGASKDALALYTGKYENFFSGDFTWNERNIDRVLKEMNQISGLKKYFKGLDEEYKEFNTHSLTEDIGTKNGHLSFNKLFEVFWDQLIKLVLYEENSENRMYVQTAYLKYISGQMYLMYKYHEMNEAKQLIQEYGEVMSKLKKAKTKDMASKVGARFVNKINSFIDLLEERQLITGIDREISKFHVPHFPAEYVNYDSDSFEPLKKVSKRILRDYFVKESFEYKKMDAKLRDYYFKIVGGKYA